MSTTKLFVPIVNTVTLMDGTETEVLGIYSTYGAALKELSTLREFQKAEPTPYGWSYVFDGEMHYSMFIKEVALDEAW